MEDQKPSDFLLWVSEQQRQIAEKMAEEQARAFDRIRARLAMFLPILTTLMIASCAGAFSGKIYAPFCVILIVGYAATTTCCALGLSTNYQFIPAHPSPEYFETIAKSVKDAENPKAETNMLVSAYMDTRIAKRGNALRWDRKWLNAVFYGMIFTPSSAFLFWAIIAAFNELS